MRVLPQRGQAKQHAALLLSPRPKTREGGERLPSSRQAGQSTSRLTEALAPPRGAQSTPGAGNTPRGAALQLRCPQNHGTALTRRHPDSAWGFCSRFIAASPETTTISAAPMVKGEEKPLHLPAAGVSQDKSKTPLGLRFLPWPNASLVRGGRTGLQSWTNPAPRLAPAPADPFRQVRGSHKPSWRLTTAP